jgi:hypothetical protein
MYALYAWQDEVAVIFLEIFELADDSAVPEAASKMLARRPTASHIIAWCGDRRVLRRDRD